MKFHTDKLTAYDMAFALQEACNAGEVDHSVGFTEFGYAGSRSHDHAFTFKLGYWDKQPGRTNRRQNGGNSGGGSSLPFAASYDEWGFYLSRLFALDPGAKVAGSYKNAADFHNATHGAYEMAVSA
jgi:hypothetical protein